MRNEIQSIIDGITSISSIHDSMHFTVCICNSFTYASEAKFELGRVLGSFRRD